MNSIVLIGLLFVFALMMPFYFILYIIAPKHKVKFLVFFSQDFNSQFRFSITIRLSKLSRFLRQPCIKFVAHTIMYLVFVVLIMISSLQFTNQEKNESRFSKHYPNLTVTMETYVNNTDLPYRAAFADFYLRPSLPNQLDIVINIWIIGDYFGVFI